MSMLSAQCDELRAMAESVGLAMPQAATLMMEAADTICELRESVHRERAEADRMQAARDVVVEDAKEIAAQLCDARAENNKLREVLDGCAILLTDNQFPHLPELREATLEDMRNLGIEVTE